jgi:hypothetical protein
LSPALGVAAVLGAGVVAQVGLAAVMGWGGPMTSSQRLGLCATAAGLVGAGVGRALQHPVGWFDVMFLGGLSLYLAANYGRAILERADDVLDDVSDGRVSPASPDGAHAPGPRKGA